MYFLVIGGHIVFDHQMTFKCETNRSNELSVFKLVENEVLHKILGLLCKKFKMAATATILVLTSRCP